MVRLFMTFSLIGAFFCSIALSAVVNAQSSVVADIAASNRSLNSVTETLDASGAFLSSTRTQLNNANQTIQRVSETPQRTVESFSRELGQTTDTLVRSNSGVNTIATRLGQVNDVLGAVNERIDNVQQALDNPARAVESLTSLPASSMSSGLGNARNAINQSIQSNNQSLRQLGDVSRQLDAGISNLNQINDLPNQTIGNLGQNLSAVSDQIGAASNGLGAVASQLGSSSSQVGGASSALAGLGGGGGGAMASAGGAASGAASAARGGGGGPSSAASKPSIDCSYSGPCQANGQTFPKEACFGVTGCCPKEKMDDMATPCESIIANYHPYNTYVEHTDDEGVPIWAKPRNPRSPRSVATAGGGAPFGYATKTRLVGDDDTAEDSGGGKGFGTNRVRACKKMLDKGDDPCLWRQELGLCLGSGALSAATEPEFTGNTQLYAGVPDIVCQQQNTLTPPPNSYCDHFDNSCNDPGSILAKEVLRQTVMMNNPASLFQGTDSVRQLPQRGKGVFQTAPGVYNEFYSRSPDYPITLASSKAFLKTPPFATYDPSEYPPGQEKKLADALFDKTPEELARMNENPLSLGNEAQAFSLGSFGGGGDKQNIMCTLEPATCELTSHFDKGSEVIERFWTGKDFTHMVSFPGMEFVSDLMEKFSQSKEKVKEMGGELMPTPFDEDIEPISREEYLRCIQAMRIQTEGSELKDLRLKESYMRTNCPERLLSCLQSQGGYSERRMEFCYEMINQPAPVAPPPRSAHMQPSNAGDKQLASASPVVSSAILPVQAMTPFQSFLFNNNPLANIGGITRNNIGKLAGVDLDQVNTILNQGVGGLGGIGGLSPHNGSQFGNAGRLGKMLHDYKSTPYSQIFNPAHIYDVRAVMNKFPERDHYSTCAVKKTCLVSENEAPFMFFQPWYYRKEPVAFIRKQERLAEIEIAKDKGRSTPVNFDPPGELFGGAPSPESIGMPPTSENTGPVRASLDGSTYYEQDPETKLAYKHLDIHYDASTLPENTAKELIASLPPKPHEQTVWDEFAAAVDENLSLASATPEQIDYFVERINKEFSKNGQKLGISRDLFLPSPVDHFLQPGEEFMGTGFSVTELLKGVGISEAVASRTAVQPALPPGADHPYTSSLTTLSMAMAVSSESLHADLSNTAYQINTTLRALEQPEQHVAAAAEALSQSQTQMDVSPDSDNADAIAQRLQTAQAQLETSLDQFESADRHLRTLERSLMTLEEKLAHPIYAQLDPLADAASGSVTRSLSGVRASLKESKAKQAENQAKMDHAKALLAERISELQSIAAYDDLALARLASKLGSLQDTLHSSVDAFQTLRQQLDRTHAEISTAAGDTASLAQLFAGSLSPAASYMSGYMRDFGSTGMEDFRDVVRCSGERDVNQIRVDVLENRYKRFNSHALQRILYNRWCFADLLDKKRCRPGRVCAPKPCHPFRPCWTKNCWKNPCSPRPHTRLDPSSEWPVASVRFDYGELKHDIAYAKRITHPCKRKDTPLYETERGDCHYYQTSCPGGERMTRAYNCRVYPNGKRYCGYSWAYHADVKYILDMWQDIGGGDFEWAAGENEMKNVCHHLAKPVPLINKTRFGSMTAMRDQNSRAAEGTCFPAYFGMRRPYVQLDNTGLEYGQTPGMRPDYHSNEGAYICMQVASSDSDQTQAISVANRLVDHLSTPVAERKEDGLRLANDAMAALPVGGGGRGGGAGGGASSSAQCCFGGMGGRTGGGCGSHGYGTQFGGMLEQMLLQARTHRTTGHNCLPHTSRLHYKSATAMALEATGAQYSTPVELPDGTESGMLRSASWPSACRGWQHHPDPSKAFPFGGGATAPKVNTGIESLLERGDEAAGAVLIWERGGAAKGEQKGMKTMTVVQSVNKERKTVSVIATDGGLWPDACGFNSGSGDRINRRLYKPGSLPDRVKSELDRLDYPTESCVMAANALGTCEFGEWDTVKWVHFGDEENLNTAAK